MRNTAYESDIETFAGKRYAHRDTPGVAFYVLGWHTEDTYPEYETECWRCEGTGDNEDDLDGLCSNCDGTGKYWTTDEEPTTERSGMVVACMVGDDHLHIIEESALREIGEDDYCHECGQIGCRHDGRDRSRDND